MVPLKHGTTLGVESALELMGEEVTTQLGWSQK